MLKYFGLSASTTVSLRLINMLPVENILPIARHAIDWIILIFLIFYSITGAANFGILSVKPDKTKIPLTFLLGPVMGASATAITIWIFADSEIQGWTLLSSVNLVIAFSTFMFFLSKILGLKIRNLFD
jgi:hypothetical protein